MIGDVMENMVRQRLRQRQAPVYCPDCLAKDLQQDLPAAGEGDVT
jgi:hypothetical protein